MRWGPTSCGNVSGCDMNQGDMVTIGTSGTSTFNKLMPKCWGYYGQVTFVEKFRDLSNFHPGLSFSPMELYRLYRVIDIKTRSYSESFEWATGRDTFQISPLATLEWRPFGGCETQPWSTSSLGRRAITNHNSTPSKHQFRLVSTSPS